MEPSEPPSARVHWSRREVLATGLSGAGWLTLGGVPAALRALGDDDVATPSELAGKTLNLVLRYRTDPERIARILPPGLEPDDVAEVTIDWWLLYPARGGENLFFPGPYTESGIHVTARYQGLRGMFQVGMPLDQDWGRVAGRETVGLVKKDGLPRLSRQGRRVRADLTRRGKLLYRIETEVLDSPAHPMFWHRETGYGAFLYRYRLHPDWRRGPLGDDPVELWLRVLGGKRGFYPTEMTARRPRRQNDPSAGGDTDHPWSEGAPRECDLGRTRFSMVEPSALDPFAELPLHAIVGMSYRETGMVPDADRAHREAETGTRIERLQLIDPKRFEPWALSTYDRPITAGRAWVPVGWPKERTAWKLTADEIERYRGRQALVIELRDCVDVRLRVAPELHARALPPGLDTGGEPILRILALDVERSDLSTAPFHELWLFARCRRDGQEAWYALSHLVGPEGDVVHGRETFGYPSRMATIDWSRDSATFALAASRLGRRVVTLGATATLAARDAETSRDESVEVVGLRLHPPYRVMTERGFVEPGPRAELVAQPWTLELVSGRSIDPARLTLELPTDAGPGRIGSPDPWYELASGEVVAVTTSRGVLRRGPGLVAGSIDSYQAWYAERFDGAMTTPEATLGEARHTFLVG